MSTGSIKPISAAVIDQIRIDALNRADGEQLKLQKAVVAKDIGGSAEVKAAVAKVNVDAQNLATQPAALAQLKTDLSALHDAELAEAQHIAATATDPNLKAAASSVATNLRTTKTALTRADGTLVSSADVINHDQQVAIRDQLVGLLNKQGELPANAAAKAAIRAQFGAARAASDDPLALADQGRADAKAGKPPQSQDAGYLLGYNDEEYLLKHDPLNA